MVGACAFPTQQGSQVYMGGMARALAEAGCDLCLLSYGHGLPHAPLPYAHLRLPQPRAYTRLRSGPDMIKPLLDIGLLTYLLNIPADIFHAHNYEAAAIACIAGRLRKIPVIYNTHGLLAEELPSYFSSAKSVYRALGARIDQGLVGQAQMVVAISKRGKQVFSLLKPRRIEMSLPGIWPEDFEGLRPLKAARPTVVYAGNPDNYQDLNVLFAAMRYLPAVTLRIVSHTAAWPSYQNTEIIKVSSWGAAREAIAGAQVAVLPRVQCAGFPIKLLNYLALGLPVVVAEGSAQGFKGEIVVKNADPRALAAGIEQALHAPTAVDTSAFIAEHAWPQRVPQILGWYQRLVGDSGPSCWPP